MHQFDPPRPDPDRRASRRRRARAVGIAAVALGAALVPATAGFGQGGPKDPKGNNGTIKIDGAPWDDAPDNEPHPGCSFEIDFYGFDQGDFWADVQLDGIAPTGGGRLLTDRVFIGEDSNAGGGSQAGLDASKRYDLHAALAGIRPQAQQGWHVDGGGLAVAQHLAAADPDVADMLAARHVDELCRGVVDRLALGAVQRHRHHVSQLAHFQRTQVVSPAHGLGGTKGGHLQRRAGRGHGRVTRHALGQQRG